MVDKTLSQVVGNSSGLTTGVIVQTPLTFTPDDKNLLPLSIEGRLLTASELSANPKLSASIPEEFARVRNPYAVATNPVIDSELLGHLVTNEAGTIVYGVNDSVISTNYMHVIKLNIATGVTSIIAAANGSASKILAVDCDASGDIVAYFKYTTGDKFLGVSTDGGASFQEVVVSNLTTANVPACTIRVSEDGKVVTLWYSYTSGTYRHVLAQVLDTAQPLVLNTNKSVTVNGNFATDTVVSINDKGSAITFTTINGGYITKDLGTTITPITLPYLKGATLVLDKYNNSNMVVVYSNESDAVVSTDEGLTWTPLPLPNILFTANTEQTGTSFYTVPSSWAKASNIATPILENGYLVIADSRHKAYLLKVGKCIEMLNVINTTSMLTGGTYVGAFCAKDGSTLSYCYGTAKEKPVSAGGLFKKGKYLPGAGLLQNLKIVGDKL